MRVKLQERSRDSIDFGIIYGTIALVALCFARLLPIQDLFPPCIFRQFSGMPCPTCGATRSMACLAHGDISAALAMNPLFALSLLAALTLFAYNIVTVAFSFRRITVSFSRTETNVARAGIILIIVLNWAYLVRFLP